jgi:hypothetical protein
MLYGTIKADTITSTIKDGRLNGNEINFSVDGETYTGRVSGKTMEGTVTTSSSKKEWKATFTE